MSSDGESSVQPDSEMREDCHIYVCVYICVYVYVTRLRDEGGLVGGVGVVYVYVYNMIYMYVSFHSTRCAR